jgi:anti-sigma regulatory factor (Ser/Thr protein kinase)
MLSFQHSLSLAQFLIPPVCMGILLGGFLLYVYMYARYRLPLYGGITLLTLLGIVFTGSEMFLLSYGAWLHNREIAVQFHRIEQLAGAYYLFALPFSLIFILQLNERWRRLNRILAFAGLGYAVASTAAAFIFPDTFISIAQPKPSGAIYEADYGRGLEGILYQLRDGLIGMYVVYSVVCFIADIRMHRNYRFLVYPVAGLMCAFIGAVIDTLFVHTGVFFDPFPNSYFSRFSVGLTIMIMCFIATATRRFIDTAKEVEVAHRIISISEEKYRLLVEGTNDCILSLGPDLRILNANKAVFAQLFVSSRDYEGKGFFDLLCFDPTSGGGIVEQFIREKVNEFFSTRKPVSFKAAFKSHGTGEPREYFVRLESINIGEKNEILARASNIYDDTLMKYLESERMRFCIGNYLIASEEISKRLVLNLAKYLDQRSVSRIRIGLREIIINAIEHGNLNITFEEKSEATMQGNYLEFIFSRQQDPLYRDKRVTIEFLLNAERVAYKIADEGNGFDYKAVIQDAGSRANEEMLAHGRGLTMAYNIFDEVTFNRRGNEVLLVKHFTEKVGSTDSEGEAAVS